MSSIPNAAQSEYDAQNYDRALELLRPLADSGNSEAQSMVGSIYHLGLGSTEQNEAEAEKWYVLASKQGHGLASNNLATLVSHRDRQRATELHQLATTQGFLHTPIQ